MNPSPSPVLSGHLAGLSCGLVTRNALPNALKAAWADDTPTIGMWVSLPDTAAAETLGGLGYDYLNVDLQHGLVDYQQSVEVLRALRSADATLTARVPWNEPGIIGKMLDAGVLGVIVPMVNSAAEAQAAVHACRYPPLGGRSHGPIRAGAIYGPDYATTANDEVACIPMIETAQALAALDEILDTPGIDAVYVGPADLSRSLGLAPGNNDGEPAFDDALAAVVSACRARGITAGIHATPKLAARRIEQGFRMVTATSDLLSLRAGAVDGLKMARNTGADGPGDAMY